LACSIHLNYFKELSLPLGNDDREEPSGAQKIKHGETAHQENCEFYLFLFHLTTLLVAQIELRRRIE
jgi:hypothetical protein